MAMIQITPELLRSEAGRIRGFGSEKEALQQKITSLVMSLNEGWKGEAQSAAVAQYQSMQPSFKALTDWIENYAKLMEEHARSMEEADTAGARMFRT